jgi:hypothetical protein
VPVRKGSLSDAAEGRHSTECDAGLDETDAALVTLSALPEREPAPDEPPAPRLRPASPLLEAAERAPPAVPERAVDWFVPLLTPALETAAVPVVTTAPMPELLVLLALFGTAPMAVTPVVVAP